MKNIVVFIVLCCALVSGCKTRNSHVRKGSLDSSVINRELSNMDFVAVSAGVNNMALRVDSSWQRAVRLINFTGVILSDGSVEGSADRVESLLSGSVNRNRNDFSARVDSVAVLASVDSLVEARVEKMEYDRQKEVEGIGVPWWVWMVLVLAIVLLGYWLGSRIKSKLNLF